MKDRLFDVLKDVVILLIVFFLGVFVSGHARGQSIGPPHPLKFCDVCPGYTLSYNAGKAEVYIRCPGTAAPWMTITKCAQPKVARHPDGVSVDITCTQPIKA